MRVTTHIGELDVRNFAQGKQAQCVRLNSFENLNTAHILKVAGEGKGYTADEATLLIMETYLYRKELKDAGVHIPENHRLDAVKVQDEYHIVMVDEFVGDGEDAKQLLETGDVWSQVSVVREILTFLHDLPAHPEYPLATSVMGDFKPDNFVLGEKLSFIDYFGPKRYGKDGLVSPYLTKMDTFDRHAITFMCGDRRGQLARFLAIINRSHLAHLGTALTAMREIYQDMPEVLAYAEEEVKGNFQRMNEIYQLKEGEWALKL